MKEITDLLDELARLRESTSGSHFMLYWSVNRKQWVGHRGFGVKFCDSNPEVVVKKLIQYIKKERKRIPKTVKYTLYP
jgi:hypothetical protein